MDFEKAMQVMDFINTNRAFVTELDSTMFLSTIGMLCDAYKVAHEDFDAPEALRMLAEVNEAVNEEMGLQGA